VPYCKNNQANFVFCSRWLILFTHLKLERLYLLAKLEKAHQAFDDFEPPFPEKKITIQFQKNSLRGREFSVRISEKK